VTWSGQAGEPVVTVSLHRPETRNAQTPATWRALASVGERLPTGTRVVVLRSEGSVFSSGIDLRAFSPEGVDGERVLASIAEADDDEAAELIAGFQAGFSWLHDIDVPTVAWYSAIGEGLIYDLRTQVFDHVQRMPIAFFTRTQTGALISRLNNDVIGAQQAFTSTLSGSSQRDRLSCVTLVAMLALSWQITLMSLVLLPVFLLPARWSGALQG
jgi:ABC-type siderophore export system fused ATPase/permease subunit